MSLLFSINVSNVSHVIKVGKVTDAFYHAILFLWKDTSGACNNMGSRIIWRRANIVLSEVLTAPLMCALYVSTEVSSNTQKEMVSSNTQKEIRVIHQIIFHPITFPSDYQHISVVEKG